ncbi:hypothetical protein MTR67_048631 [Solanum verrucosum]|uniref:Uncharacterized protein n=1 Tax=Solanum verrucosum TaxID=315347 RepID=A0AAF0ZXL0_SOLVR|nr:hypothetical protein MTR67_048631 [Solanum verrucosum]
MADLLTTRKHGGSSARAPRYGANTDLTACLMLVISQDEGSFGDQQWFLSVVHVQGVNSSRDRFGEMWLGLQYHLPSHST